MFWATGTPGKAANAAENHKIRSTLQPLGTVPRKQRLLGRILSIPRAFPVYWMCGKDAEWTERKRAPGDSRRRLWPRKNWTRGRRCRDADGAAAEHNAAHQPE